MWQDIELKPLLQCWLKLVDAKALVKILQYVWTYNDSDSVKISEVKLSLADSTYHLSFYFHYDQLATGIFSDFNSIIIYSGDRDIHIMAVFKHYFSVHSNCDVKTNRPSIV